MNDIEVWAGLECTVNRVGNEFRNQLTCNGHWHRASDLTRFAEMGIKKIRYPAMWELFQHDEDRAPDFSWAKERFDELKRLGLEPIAGLLHHGSGPQFTNLLDPEFPEKFARYSQSFAETFPWISDYTPVNEPLTTARFSALYGFWYPHHTSTSSFLKALINQCRATALGMKAIRKINPLARLIQTEDLGFISSTKKLAYQALFENRRRWLSLDLLVGNVKKGHPLYKFFLQNGISAEELHWFEINRCPPSTIGINHYVTSNRFLDHRLAHYPKSIHGGNNRHRYVDVETVRVSVEPTSGTISELLTAAWERYKIPLAVTETHIGGHREDQIRWVNEVWDAASDIQKKGVEIKAVTAWSLLGSYDWNSLCTQNKSHYESGVFDSRLNNVRPTAVATAWTSLAKTKKFNHPLLAVPGWWKRDIRVVFPEPKTPSSSFSVDRPTQKDLQPVVITGARGRLGRAFIRAFEVRGIPYRALNRSELDITNANQIEEIIRALKPWAIVNAAGYAHVDDAELNIEKCFNENTKGPELLARASKAHGLQLLTFSSHFVFGGRAHLEAPHPYIESHAVNPLNVYGRSKVEAELRVLDINPDALIIRSSSFFGTTDEQSFIGQCLRNLALGQTYAAPSNITISPTYLPDLVDTSIDLLIDQTKGIWHLSNKGVITCFEFAKEVVERASLNSRLLIAATAEDLGFKAPRPFYSALGSERGNLMPKLETSLDRYFEETRAQSA